MRRICECPFGTYAWELRKLLNVAATCCGYWNMDSSSSSFPPVVSILIPVHPRQTAECRSHSLSWRGPNENGGVRPAR